MSNSQQLTSVKVDIQTFNDFKHKCISYKFSLQKLVDRAMLLYIEDEEFRSKIHNTNNLEYKENKD